MHTILNVSVYPTTDFTLPTFDNTKLVAINTCPVWGIVRYTQHKVFKGTGRAMALEAGAAAHEVFAAHRLYAFREFAGTSALRLDEATVGTLFEANGQRVFGQSRFGEMLGAVDQREDYRTRSNAFALAALYNSGFYDDPDDKRRTVTNIEESCITYMDQYRWDKEIPAYLGGDLIGIEIPIDVTVEIEYVEGDPSKTFNTQKLVVRFIGKADGVHYKDHTCEEMRVHENKTASRLGSAWELSWDTNHQPTGYQIGLSAMFAPHQLNQTVMLGVALPMPRAFTYNGLSRIVVNRHNWQYAEWFSWFLHTVLLHERFKDDVINAPMYTHSCNRYFRPCSFIMLCSAPPDERADMIAEMDEEEWSPLHTQGEPTDE